ncbi:MAG: hypothetical protein ABIF10_02400 [Candidatus Woesearchaeota archaeon]
MGLEEDKDLRNIAEKLLYRFNADVIEVVYGGTAMPAHRRKSPIYRICSPCPRSGMYNEVEDLKLHTLQEFPRLLGDIF